jgi:TonB family protein
MYFNFEDDRPDTPTIARPLSPREGVMVSIILHLVAMIIILVLPTLPFVKAAEERRQQQLQEIQKQRALEMQRSRENPRFVFVQPRVEMEAPTPPRRAELSDIDRRARTVERAPNPTNPLPFARGNSAERIDSPTSPEPIRPKPDPAPPPQPADGEAARQAMSLPEAPNGFEPPSSEAARQQNESKAVGVIAEAIRNVRKYAQTEGFGNLQGGADQDFAPFIQFDTKGVEFGPWLRRFIAQVRRNWIPLIPEAAMTMRGHAVITFYVHRDGRITDVSVAKPSTVDGFTRAAFYAMLASNPTVALPPEYPEDKVFFTVTFYYNQRPQ